LRLVLALGGGGGFLLFFLLEFFLLCNRKITVNGFEVLVSLFI